MDQADTGRRGKRRARRRRGGASAYAGDQNRTGGSQETRQAEAALQASESSLTKAKLDLDRARELVQKQVFSQAALDAADAAFVGARSQRDRAQEG